MIHHIDRLHRIAHQPVRIILGLMAGTSLDGLDLALCRLEGSGFESRLEVTHFETVPFEENFKAETRRVFALKTIDFQHLVLLNVVVAEYHAAIILDALKRWNIAPEAVDLIASHGQTVFHAPRQFHGLEQYPNATLQIGDGDHLARRTGIITLSDFRQKHLAAGGEGAPLALYGDYFLFSAKGEDRFLLNIGGIANFTFLPGNGEAARVFATDTGPGNTLLDAAAQRFFNQPYDADARLAAGGQIRPELLARLLESPFLRLPFPKTTGPEQFSLDGVLALAPPDIRPADLLATLTRFTAETIAADLKRVERTSTQNGLYLSGGGAHNPLVLQYLRELLPDWPMAPMEKLGVDGDAKEAVLFAVLANETVAGTSLPDAVLGGLPLVSMGKISIPG